MSAVYEGDVLVSLTCPMCNMTKEPTKFYNNKASKTGKSPYCKTCWDEEMHIITLAKRRARAIKQINDALTPKVQVLVKDMEHPRREQLVAAHLYEQGKITGYRWLDQRFGEPQVWWVGDHWVDMRTTRTFTSWFDSKPMPKYGVTGS